MKFTVKKYLFATLVMSASVSLPMFNGQQGQGYAAFDQNDPVIQALSFYQHANVLLGVGKSLYEVIKPTFGLTASLDAQNPWAQRKGEKSSFYVGRLLNTITQTFGASINATKEASSVAQYAKSCAKGAKDRVLYGADFLPDLGGQNSRMPEAWANTQKVRTEKKVLDTDLKELKACKSASEKKKKYHVLMKKWSEDKVTASGDRDLITRYSEYQQKLIAVASELGIGNKSNQAYEEVRV